MDLLSHFIFVTPACVSFAIINKKKHKNRHNEQKHIREIAIKDIQDEVDSAEPRSYRKPEGVEITPL